MVQYVASVVTMTHIASVGVQCTFFRDVVELVERGHFNCILLYLGSHSLEPLW